jgi:hypothetical protein
MTRIKLFLSLTLYDMSDILAFLGCLRIAVHHIVELKYEIILIVRATWRLSNADLAVKQNSCKRFDWLCCSIIEMPTSHLTSTFIYCAQLSIGSTGTR